MDKLFASMLVLLFFSVLCCSATETGVRHHFGHVEGEQNRLKNREGEQELCTCPGSHGPQKQTNHKRGCPCNPIDFHLTEHAHHHRHDKTKHHRHHKKQSCLMFLRRCRLKRLHVPL
uniref:C-X-C motif chemokine 17 n=1 Tax=Pogona vitticeps TaxID=103695 RepID=A0ABM5ER17_9SAUR